MHASRCSHLWASIFLSLFGVLLLLPDGSSSSSARTLFSMFFMRPAFGCSAACRNTRKSGNWWQQCSAHHMHVRFMKHFRLQCICLADSWGVLFSCQAGLLMTPQEPVTPHSFQCLHAVGCKLTHMFHPSGHGTSFSSHDQPGHRQCKGHSRCMREQTAHAASHAAESTTEYVGSTSKMPNGCLVHMHRASLLKTKQRSGQRPGIARAVPVRVCCCAAIAVQAKSLASAEQPGGQYCKCRLCLPHEWCRQLHL